MGAAKFSGPPVTVGFVDESEGAPWPTLCDRCGHGLVAHPQFFLDPVKPTGRWAPIARVRRAVRGFPSAHRGAAAMKKICPACGELSKRHTLDQVERSAARIAPNAEGGEPVTWERSKFPEQVPTEDLVLELERRAVNTAKIRARLGTFDPPVELSSSAPECPGGWPHHANTGLWLAWAMVAVAVGFVVGRVRGWW